MMRGAGGTEGGILTFILGIGMFVVGLYLFLTNITVTNSFGMGTSIFSLGSGNGFHVTTGYILIPFIIGIILIFYNYKFFLGWILSVASIGLLIFGVISSFNFRWHSMNAFDTIIVIVLLFGGLGLFLNSLRSARRI